MLFAFFDVPVRSHLLLLLHFTFLSRLLALFLFDYVKHGWVLVLPVTNGSGDSNNALDSSVVDKPASCPYPLHFASIIRLVIVAQLCHLSIPADEDGPRVTGVGTI